MLFISSFLLITSNPLSRLFQESALFMNEITASKITYVHGDSDKLGIWLSAEFSEEND